MKGATQLNIRAVGTSDMILTLQCSLCSADILLLRASVSSYQDPGTSQALIDIAANPAWGSNLSADQAMRPLAWTIYTATAPTEMTISQSVCLLHRADVRRIITLDIPGNCYHLLAALRKVNAPLANHRLSCC